MDTTLPWQYYRQQGATHGPCVESSNWMASDQSAQTCLSTNQSSRFIAQNHDIDIQ